MIISDFLDQTGNAWRIFDMGRRVTRLPEGAFRKFEEGSAPYPYPLQQHAWLGILNWSPRVADEHFIWFLKLPLDEAAGLVPAARDDFMYRLLKTLKNSACASQDSRQIEDALRDSPYGFTPNQERMAVFHARALRTMGRPASSYYPHARDYLSGAVGYDQWAFVGMQGIADVCARLDQDGNAALLASALPRLPEQPLEAVCKCLENEEVPTALAEAIVNRLDGVMGDGDSRSLQVSALLRALSCARATGLRRAAITKVLESDYRSSIDVLVTVSSRCWEDLKDGALCRRYLEALADAGEGQIFNAVVADLLYIPGMREPVLSQLRDPARSERLAAAFGGFFRALGA